MGITESIIVTSPYKINENTSIRFNYKTSNEKRICKYFYVRVQIKALFAVSIKIICDMCSCQCVIVNEAGMSLTETDDWCIHRYVHAVFVSCHGISRVSLMRHVFPIEHLNCYYLETHGNLLCVFELSTVAMRMGTTLCVS